MGPEHRLKNSVQITSLVSFSIEQTVNFQIPKLNEIDTNIINIYGKIKFQLNQQPIVSNFDLPASFPWQGNAM